MLKAVIGLEMHCEMTSNSKVYSSAKNGYSSNPNIYVKELDMAFPGTLPVVNKECVRKSILVASIIHATIPKTLLFDRKNYYYPDLPKGYQITQNTSPIGVGGSLTILVNGKEKEVKIHDVHLEEDTASLDHGSDTSYINYNRCGVPLLELVTEPCLESAEEAVAFLETVRQIYQYTDISEADTKKGQIRCDVNVSLMESDAKELGTRAEVKNVNGIRNVYDTITYEIERQTKLIEAGKGNEITQETRRFDEETGTTIHMRSKEDALDYKYFVEPNIPEIPIDREWIQEIASQIPQLPLERRKKYIETYGLSDYDATILIKEKEISDYFEELIKLHCDPKVASNWLTVTIMGYINKENKSIKEIFITPNRLAKLLAFVENGTISNSQAKEIFIKSLEEEKEIDSYIKEENAQISDASVLNTLIDSILEKSPNQIEAYHNGKTNLFDYFVGQVMKETKGKANPALTKELLTHKLNEKE